MSRLAITLIDVGWGDSILIESEDKNSKHYALVDCNDSANSRSSFIFLKRFFERQKHPIDPRALTFDFVVLTHNHADHLSGLKSVFKHFGVSTFLYPNSQQGAGKANLLRFAIRSDRVRHHQPIDNTIDTSRISQRFGAVRMEVLWPPPGYSANNENLFSVVMALTLGQVTFVLTGDAEAEVWPFILGRLPATTHVFQVPHHGARNGLFDNSNSTPWLNHLLGLGHNVRLGMSSHIEPHKHPHPSVTAELDAKGVDYYHTDLHYHITFETNGKKVSVRYSHT